MKLIDPEILRRLAAENRRILENKERLIAALLRLDAQMKKADRIPQGARA